MKRQIGFAEAEIAGKKRVTRRQRFLEEMEKVVPWQRLLSAIEPHYPKGTRGRPPIGLERMLRIYFVQQWYGLSDKDWKTRCMTASRCEPSPASIWRSRTCLMQPRC
ncbi:transporter PF05598 domain protein [Burkholderia multivorans CF2]|nr:transporter PF05598 domain protein [Burkholderia multivorans CF2]